MRHFTSCIATLLVAAFILAIHAPAQAALTAALTATTPTITGVCPATEALTGTISGPAGTTFQYSFNRYINGVQQVQNVGAATIPASGTMAVSDYFNIASTSTGINFDQIWVHNIGGGQPDAYSNKATYSVTCSSGVNVPPGQLKSQYAGGLLHDPNDAAGNPAAPYDIATSGDPKVCAAHIPNPLIAGLICPGIAQAGKLFIVWTWSPSPICKSCPQDVDGYKIYLTNAAASTKTYLDRTSAGTSTTVSIVSAPGGNFVGKCFSVSAYKGAKESTLGPPTCLNAQPKVGTTPTILLPIHARSANMSHVKGTGIITSIGVDGHQLFSGKMAAGFTYSNDVAITGDTYYDTIVRGGVLFDLSSLMGKPITSATLILDAQTNAKDPLKKSCATELGTGKNAWWTNSDWIEGDWVEIMPTNVAEPHIDVTNEVRGWLNGAPNFGFVIKQLNENLTIFADDRCLSTYTASLDVVHF